MCQPTWASWATTILLMTMSSEIDASELCSTMAVGWWWGETCLHNTVIVSHHHKISWFIDVHLFLLWPQPSSLESLHVLMQSIYSGESLTPGTLAVWAVAQEYWFVQLSSDSDLLSIVSHKGHYLDTLFPVCIMQVLVVKLQSTFLASPRHGWGVSNEDRWWWEVVIVVERQEGSNTNSHSTCWSLYLLFP